MTNLRKTLVFSVFFLPLNLSAGEVDFSGFATLAGGIIFNESTKDTTITDDEISYQGYDDDIGFDSKSLVGLQASAELADGWGFTTQFVARGSESWDLNAEWAFLSYDANDNWRFLFGRQRAPFYMYSDFLDVSYAYHWIKPPSGVYSIVFDVIDGVGSIFKSTIGDVDSTVHLTFGRNRDPARILDVDRTSDFPNFFSASWTLNWDWLTFRTSYARTDLSIEFDNISPLLQGWRGTPFASIADDLEIKDDTAEFGGIAFTIDYNDYLLTGEYTKIFLKDTFLPEQDSYYISFGKRFDNILIHLTYGADENKSDFGILDKVTVPAGVNPQLDMLVGGSKNALLSVQEDSSFYTLGLRWEVSDSVALKVEYTEFENKDTFSGEEASLIETALTTVF
ncbi:MAG: porin [Gammaproteobacteria bacterium]|nr:porin [Gammaproteobacteria bacterium]